MKKWLKTLFISCALVLIGAGFVSAYASTSTGVCAEEETSEVVEEQPQEEEEKKEDWIKKSYETYIVPLLSGVSITSIVSAVACVAVTLIKNRQLNNKLLLLQEEANKHKEEADMIYQRANNKLAEVTEALSLIREVNEVCVNDSKLNAEVKAYVEAQLKTMANKIDENNKEVLKIEKLKAVTALLVQLETKVAKQSMEVVKSGIIDDVNKIAQLVREI